MAVLPWWCLIGAVLGVAAFGSSHGAVLSFAKETYVISPGETVALEVRIIRNPTDEPDELFSYGLRLTHQAGGSLSVTGITVPTPLDFFQLSAGAFIDLSESVIGVKGNVEFSPLVPYTGELLATFEISFDAVGEYEIGLDIFNTLGPTEQVFLSGDGTVLDDTITFGSTTVRVVDGEQIRPVLAIGRSGATGDDVDLRFPTIVGFTYTAQRSDDLEDWTGLVTSEGDGEEFFFRDLGGGAARRAFYRVTVTTTAR
jgi:hypothetical protein